MSQQRDTVSLGRGLSGRRILITRAPHQASQLADRLGALGATPILIPTIEIAPPASFTGLDAALALLSGFDLVVFTSANAVEAFRQRALLLGIAPAPRRIAVVGPATVRAVEAIGHHADLVPSVFTAESLAQTIVHTVLSEVPGANILLVLAEQAPATLRSALTAAGAHVTVAAAYCNRIPQTSLAAVADLFAGPEKVPDAVTFTSASTAGNLVALLEAVGHTLPASVMRASIGPVTSRALCDLGLPPHLEAAEPTVAALAEALAAHFQKDAAFP
ncbi:MAG TPA: uroporphyrinogen-III synthase [Acidobacteriaceae bacterium]|nr:uroporphyrinogen-III synthase [Acidobacteriaceae bacterium]